MDETNMKEVRFDKWCSRCEHKDLDEHKDPCNACLDYGGREGSAKPEYFKEK